MNIEEIINNLYAQITAIVSGLLIIIKIIKEIWLKLTKAKAKTDRRDIENTKTALKEIKEELTKNG